MERKKVRIYKAPDGRGEYINKTGQFLKKAQMGAETTNEAVMQQKQIEPIMQFVAGALDNEMEPEQIMKLLVSKGLPKELVYSVISSVMQEREAPAEEEEEGKKEQPAEESKIGQSEFQPIGEEEAPVEEDQGMDYYNSYADEPEPVIEEEYQDGGPILSYGDLQSNEEKQSSEMSPELIEKLTSLKEFVDAGPKDNFEDFGKDISEYAGAYTPVEWDVLGDGYGYYKKGGSKKNFTKNVLALVKKAEGGDTQEIGKGVKKDTLTNDVSKIKSSFVSKLKEVSNKAAIDSLYEKMMGSNNPELMQSAQELAQKREQNSQMGTFEPVAQQGGYIGEGQPDMFNYGGFDMPEAQKGGMQKLGDFLLGEKYTVANNPYNARTGALYRDPLSNLTPVARTVHKRGIFGRPKKYTDYYSKGNKVDQDFVNNFTEYKPKTETKKTEYKKTEDKKDAGKNKWGYTEKEWDDFSGEAKRAERRGQRRLNRQMARGEEMNAKDKAFMSTPNLIQQFDGYTEQINDADGNRLKIPKLLEITKELEPELSFEERMGMNDPEFYRTEPKEEPLVDHWSEEDEAILDERRAEADAIYQQVLKERAEQEQQAKAAEAERRLQASKFYANYPEGNTERRIGLGDATDPDINYQAKIRDNAYNQFAKLRDFMPDKKAFDAYEIKRKEMQALRDAEEARLQLENDIKSQEYEKRYGGGLGKYQIKGAVKSPGNELSDDSDPTANSANLINTLKPQDNSNTFMGASAPWMNQNIPTNTESKVETITMDPNQTKDQKITSLDFGDPAKDDIVAQDVKTKRKFNGTNFDMKLNAGIDAFTSGMRGLDTAKQQNEMFANNFNADKLYGASTDKDRGDYVAYGQQTGMFRPDETGQETMGRFAYGQRGGYMQDGGYTEGDEVDMTEEELAEFIANGGEVEYL